MKGRRPALLNYMWVLLAMLSWMQIDFVANPYINLIIGFSTSRDKAPIVKRHLFIWSNFIPSVILSSLPLNRNLKMK